MLCGLPNPHSNALWFAQPTEQCSVGCRTHIAMLYGLPVPETMLGGLPNPQSIPLWVGQTMWGAQITEHCSVGWPTHSIDPLVAQPAQQCSAGSPTHGVMLCELPNPQSNGNALGCSTLPS